MKSKYTDEQLIEAVKSSKNMRELLSSLNVAISGSMSNIVKKRLAHLNIDTSHWNKKWNPQFTIFGRKNVPLDEIFKSNSPWSPNFIRQTIRKNNLIEYKCNICGIETWNNLQITLQLDHINGDRKDNRLENLRYLCPNCHSQTPTWGTKSRKEVFNCLSCGRTITKGATQCLSCANSIKISPTKIIWPSIEELLKLLETFTYVDLSKQLGVSDNAIRKHIRKYSSK